MAKRALMSAALLVSTGAGAQEYRFDASYEDIGTRIMLVTLADAAGYVIENPEVIRGSIDARARGEDARTLFPRLVKGLGFDLEVHGDSVRLKRIESC